MQALVTGATGLVGSYIADRLCREGWQVRALVRDAARARWLRSELGAELYPGDIRDTARVRAAARGSAAVFHTAAAISAAGAGWEAYRSVNVDGTRSAVAAARASGARLVHISSVAVYGATTRYRDDGGLTDEETPLAPLPEGAHYARSKRESEAVVLEQHRRGELWAVALRPDVIYGRRDRQFVPRVARALSVGIAPVLGSGRTPLAVVHAANVADAAVRAAVLEGPGGRAYNIANDFDVTFREFVRFAGAGLGQHIRTLPVPLLAGRVLLAAASAAVRVAGRGVAPTTTAGTLAFLTRGNPFTSMRARQELGWTPTVQPVDGIPDAFRWWREHAQ